MNSSTTEPAPDSAPATEGETQRVETSTLLLDKSRAELNRLMEEAMRNAEPQLAAVMERFRSEIDASVQRTVDDFKNLPTVHRVMQDWSNAGLPPNDITFLLLDVAALLDLRNSQSHQSQARLIGMLSDAVMSVAHVYTLAYQESAAARKETENLRAEMARLMKANAAVVKQMELTAGVMKTNAQQSYDLTVILGQTRMRSILLWAGVAAGGVVLGVLVTLLIVWVKTRF